MQIYYFHAMLQRENQTILAISRLFSFSSKFSIVNRNMYTLRYNNIYSMRFSFSLLTHRLRHATRLHGADDKQYFLLHSLCMIDVYASRQAAKLTHN